MDSRNPAIKRLKREYDEILESNDDPSPLPFMVYPLEENFFEWHFTLLGPTDSVYEGGRYHGKIQFPPDYPFSPPSLQFLTPSGRFQVNRKICLSVTGFHPEHWQPAWGVRTILLAVQDHFTVEDRAAIGYLHFPPAERQRLARESRRLGCNACAYRYFLEDLRSERDHDSDNGNDDKDDGYDDDKNDNDKNHTNEDEFDEFDDVTSTADIAEDTRINNHPNRLLFLFGLAVLLIAYYLFIK